MHGKTRRAAVASNCVATPLTPDIVSYVPYKPSLSIESLDTYSNDNVKLWEIEFIFDFLFEFNFALFRKAIKHQKFE